MDTKKTWNLNSFNLHTISWENNLEQNFNFEMAPLKPQRAIKEREREREREKRERKEKWGAQET
jgi:hypothetical protein